MTMVTMNTTTISSINIPPPSHQAPAGRYTTGRIFLLFHLVRMSRTFKITAIAIIKDQDSILPSHRAPADRGATDASISSTPEGRGRLPRLGKIGIRVFFPEKALSTEITKG